MQNVFSLRYAYHWNNDRKSSIIVPLLRPVAQCRHFSMTRYALHSRRVWSTEAVIDASPRFQSISLLLPPVLVRHRWCVYVRASGASKLKRGRWRGGHRDCHAGCACVAPLPRGFFVLLVVTICIMVEMR